MLEIRFRGRRISRVAALLASLALTAGLTACGGGGSPSSGAASAKPPSDRAMPQAGGVGAGAGVQGLFVDRIDSDERVTQITVCAGWLIDSVQVVTDKRVLPKRGGPGGACQTLALLPGEAIARVFGSAGAVINSLGFETTNARTFGPFGTAGASGGLPFSMYTAGTFRGFTGSDGTYSNVLVLAQLNLIGDKTGGVGGANFIDRMQPDEKVVEVKICYRTDAYVGSVQLRTNLGWRAKRGADAQAGTPVCSSTTLGADEYIVELFGNADQYVNSLGLLTSTGRRIGPFGGPGGTGFSQTVLDPSRKNFVGWFGAAGSWIDKIGLMTHPAGLLEGSDVFLDHVPAGEVINRVKICTFFSNVYQTTVVRSVQAFTAQRALPLYGGPPATGIGLTCTDIAFSAGEFITEMFGRVGGAIDALGLRTNTGREIKPLGGPGGAPFLLRNPSTTGFHGFAGRHAYNANVLALDFAAPDLFPPVLPPSASAPTQGWWSDVVNWPIIGIHASVLGDGRVVTYGSDASGTQGAFVYDIWNPALGTGNNAHMTLPVTTGTDIFCSAQSLFANGTLMLAGGDNRQNGGYNRGVTDVNFFNPATNSLTKMAAGLKRARWYATQTMLPSGRVLAIGGIDGAGMGVPEPELYTPATNSWALLTGATSGVYSGNSYPRVFVAPLPVNASTDEVYVIPTGSSKIYRITVNAAGAATVADTGVVLPGNHDWQRPAIQFAPGKVLMSLSKQIPGGGIDGAGTVIVNLPTTAGGTPTWAHAAPLSQQRLWSNFVMLPTGEVLALGGAAKDNGAVDLLSTTAQHAEIWTPPTSENPQGVWRRGASELRPRLYHGTAVLLVDGRVLSTGGGAPGKVHNLNSQLYSPPYLYQAGGNGAAAARPTISSAPDLLANNGASFTIQSPQAGTVQKVTLTRMGSTTHAFDFDARHVPLNIVSRTSGALTVTAPASRFIAPPGRYMLTVVNNGVPSVSKAVRIE